MTSMQRSKPKTCHGRMGQLERLKYKVAMPQ